jgi:hypothetical protein
VWCANPPISVTIYRSRTFPASVFLVKPSYSQQFLETRSTTFEHSLPRHQLPAADRLYLLAAILECIKYRYALRRCFAAASTIIIIKFEPITMCLLAYLARVYTCTRALAVSPREFLLTIEAYVSHLVCMTPRVDNESNICSQRTGNLGRDNDISMMYCIHFGTEHFSPRVDRH